MKYLLVFFNVILLSPYELRFSYILKSKTLRFKKSLCVLTSFVVLLLPSNHFNVNFLPALKTQISWLGS
jgi:hypothetical protein